MKKQDVSKAMLLAMATEEGLAVSPQGRMQCPWRCSDDKRSATVSDKPTGALWHCKRCDKSGSAVDLLAAARGISPGEALRALEHRGAPAPIHLEEAPRIDVERVWRRCVENDPRGVDYLRKRGLQDAAARGLVRFNTGATGAEWVDKLASTYRVVMPLFDAQGVLRSLQLRAIAPREVAKLSLPGISTSALAFGFVEKARTAPVVHLCEGIADTLALMLAGTVVLGAPGCDSVPHLAGFVGDPAGREFVLCRQRDADPKAQAQADRAFAKLEAALTAKGAGVRSIFPPEGTKDPADWLLADRAAFEAALTAPPEPDPDPLDLARAMVTKLAKVVANDPGAAMQEDALAAFALLSEADKPAWVNAKQMLKRAGVVRDVESVLRERKKQARRGATSNAPETKVADAIDAPAAAQDFVIPKGYCLTEHMTAHFRQVEDPLSKQVQVQREQLAPAPVLISMRHRDEEAGSELLRVSWRRHERWYERVVPRAQAMNAAKLLELADAGLPVGSHNTKELSRYLADFEAANDQALTGPRISSRLGWQGKRAGDAGFLLGRAYIPRDGGDPVNLDLEELPANWQEDWIAFRGPDLGDEQIADGFVQTGTWEGWCRAIEPLQHHPRALLALYAAFVPPMLELLGAPNFIVDWAGRTSLGKTTVLRAAASVWGCPNERAAASMIASWDATRVAVERRGALLSSLPLIVDDTKRARSAKDVAAVLYAVANGRGRDRGSIKGTAATRAWRTVLLSSGEAPAVSYTEDGGTRARVLEITGSPFSGEGTDTRRIVDHVNRQVQIHHGHAGLALVRAIAAERDRWPDLAASLRRREEEIAEVIPSGVGARLAAYVAAIETAAAFAHEHLQLPFAQVDVFADLWPELIGAVEEAPPEIRALQAIGGWCLANESKFQERGAYEPSHGWAGTWPKGDGWSYIALFPQVFRRVSKELGFEEPDAILEAARGRGWLRTDGDKGHYTRRLGPDRKRFVVIRRAALAEVGVISGSIFEDNSEFEARDAG